MPTKEHLERLKFYESAFNLLEIEQQQYRQHQETQPGYIKEYVDAISPSSLYPINQLLEDFVESSSLRTLEHIHELLLCHPLVLENPESTKMGVLKIFNLFSKRHCEGFEAENMARFMLLVAGSVRISDRSGVNLKGERNCSHFKIVGESCSAIVVLIREIQLLLYSPGAHSSKIVKLVSSFCSAISSSLIESDDLLNPASRLESAPYFLLDASSETIDVNSAIIVLIQCLILTEPIDDKEVKKLIIACLKKTTVGRRIVKFLPIIMNSDQRWRRWKTEQQCNDFSRPCLEISVNELYSHNITSILPEIDLTTTSTIISDTPTTRGDFEESDWAVHRRKAFGT